MMCRTSIFALLAAAMTFAAKGVGITVYESVDAHIGSVMVSAGSQHETVNRSGSFTWGAWYADTAYTASASNVDPGYTARWKVTKSGLATKEGAINQPITLSSDYSGCALSFYGQPNTYAVTLDRQSGNGGTSSVTATYDAAMPSATMPTRTGYTFGGYYTAVNGGGTQYYAATGASARNWDRTSATTLYAKWTVVTSTVTLDSQSGNGGTSSVTATYDAAMPSITVPTRTGYTFGGYYTTANGGGTQYYTATGASARNWDRTSATTLYAKWTAISSTVTLNMQSGSGGSSSVEATYGQAMPSITVPTRTGYAFGGYYALANGGGVKYYNANGTSARNWDRSSATTLYAQWTAIKSTVALDWQSGSGGAPTVQATYGQAMTTPIDLPRRTGYTFSGYYTAMNGGGTQYYTATGASARNWDIAATNTTLYAKWTANTYTVIFDANGGDGAMNPVTCTYNVPTNLPTCTFARDGYGFKGWMTNANDEVLFADCACVSNLTTKAEEVTMYACWTGVTYAVVLDARDPFGEDNGVFTNGNGEAVSILTNPYTVGDAWELPTPVTNVNTHLLFAGWKYVDAQGVTNDVPDVVPPPSAGVTNLVASWTRVDDDLALALDAAGLGLEFNTFGTAGGEPPYVVNSFSADWVVQTDVVSNSPSAVQSGRLPESGYGMIYASWLTVKVTGRGVLSFWWKCSATNRSHTDPADPTSRAYGDVFYFGRCDRTENGVFWTEELAALEGVKDWCQVVFTKDTDEDVTFAWKFQFDAYNNVTNGGGTGWVDRVTWTPLEEVTSTNKVPYSWLRTNFPDYASATGDELESLAESQSPGEGLPPGKTWPNGEPVMVWQDYWAGTNPHDPNDLFRADIAVSNNVPYITWQPDLRTNDPPRVYHVLCAPTPSASAQEWVEWPGPGDSGASTNRFFKVKLDWEGSQKN